MRTELQASNRADLRLSGCAYVVCLLALTLTMASCGDAMPGGDNVAGDGLGAGANGDLGVVVNDSATVDVTTDGATDAGKLDVSTDVGTSCPGGGGCPCDKNDDCDIALCIDTPDGAQCARSCVETCPDDFTCSAIPNGSGDTLTVCVPTHGRLCNPCSASASCAALGQKSPACVVHGDAGAYCGSDCKNADDCPSGFGCKELPTIEGAKATQCVPVASGEAEIGACACSKAAISAKLSTTCMAPTKDSGGNVIGSCPGERACGEQGLGACAAAEVSDEVCDGLDNDCDGKTDNATCDDGNACTVDACAPGGDGAVACSHANTDVPCDADSNVCSENDACQSGTCIAGKIKSCTDSNPCTSEGCDPKLGCIKSNDDGAPCDDDNPCTVGELCQNGGCLAGLPKACTSTDACQTVKCDQSDGKCKFTAKQDGLPCNDATVCSSADACSGGICLGEVINCNDGNPCTNDACDDKKGCNSVASTVPCDDGDACTSGDACTEGACKPGAPLGCDDKDACTIDGCDGKSGNCTFATVPGCGGNCDDAGDCDDNNPCTNDICVGGKCAIKTNTDACNDADACTDKDLCSAGACSGSPISCDDGEVCTSDSCLKGQGCDHAANSLGCDDGDACSIGDACAGGKCQPGAGKVCNDANPCTDDACDAKTGDCTKNNNAAVCNDNEACTSGDVCVGGACTPGKAKVCDDGKVCTDDKCDSVSGACVVSNNTSVCSDNNACTNGDSCTAGACKAGAAKSCDDKNACTTDSCDAKTGACSNKPIVGCGGNCVSVGDCDDKNPCTTDACTSGKCANAANSDGCDDGDSCTVADACKGGICVAGANKVCSDNNVCTDDSCDPKTGACINGNNTAPCNDNDACTTSDACAVGACKPGKPVDCDDNNPCTIGEGCKAGACVKGTPVVCDDGKVCTDDSCDKATGKCVVANNTVPCSDANACTAGDICAAGVCKAGAAKVCNDANPCTNDSCNTTTGACVFANNTAVCNDSDACTTGDICAVGVCKPGKSTLCDDGNPCTADSCDKVSGKCVIKQTTAPCNDGNACTSGDVCDGAGKCAGINAVVCKNTACTDNACNPGTGSCDIKPKPAKTTCDDGQLCTVGDACDGAGSCTPGPWNDACGCQSNAACDDKNACTKDSCTANKCVYLVLTAAVCDDGDPCSTTSACDSGGKCVAKTLVDCSGGNDACNTAVCQNNKGNPVCAKVPKAAKTACNDGLFCTTADACDGLGSCAGGPPPLCGKPAQCYQALCLEKAGGCTFVPQADGNPCNDSSACTSVDVCKAGKCAGTVNDACTPTIKMTNPKSPSTSAATTVLGNALSGSKVSVYPSANCTGKPLNPTPTTATSGYSTDITVASQSCTPLSAAAVDAVGVQSKCSNSVTYAHYECTQCVCSASDWIRLFGGAGNESGYNAAYDASGNVYLVGYTSGAMPGSKNLGGNDGFLAKFDVSGGLQWIKQIGTTANDSTTAVLVDPIGQIFVAGVTSGDIDGKGPALAPAAGDIDTFVQRYDANGVLAWTKVYGTTTRMESITNMAYDPVGKRVVAVMLSSVFPSGSGQSPALLTVNPTTGAIALLWSYIENGQNKNPVGVVVDTAGNIYLQGRSQWAINGAVSKLGSAGGGAYVYKVSGLGKTLWVTHWGSDAFDYPGDLTVDNGGVVYCSGFVQGLAYGAAKGTAYLGSTGSSWGHGGDFVVVALNATTGAQNWLTQTGTKGGDAGTSIAYQPAKLGGALYLVGWTTGNLATGAATSLYGKADIAVVKLNLAGAIIETHAFGGPGDDVAGRLGSVSGKMVIPGSATSDWVGQGVDSCAFNGGTDVVAVRMCLSGATAPLVK